MGRAAGLGKRNALRGRRATALSARPVPEDTRLRSLRSLLLIALLCTGLATGAAAQIREGRYAVLGVNPDGTEYRGELALQTGPAAAWIVTWLVGQEQVMGLGIIQGGVLAVSFSVNGRPGIAVYEVERDGTLRGTWNTGGGLGTEKLTPQ